MDKQRYIKLFNHGYFLSKNEPGILNNLLAATKNQPDITASLKAGAAEFRKEQIREQLRQKHHELKSKDKTKDRGGHDR